MRGGWGASAAVPDGPDEEPGPSAGAEEVRPGETRPDPAAAEQAGATGPRRAERRTYRSPLLLRHGRLAEATRFGGSEILDSGGGLGQQL